MLMNPAQAATNLAMQETLYAANAVQLSDKNIRKYARCAPFSRLRERGPTARISLN